MHGATYKNREKTGNTAGPGAAVCAVYFADVIRNSLAGQGFGRKP
jgi:hypothetical protein